MALKKMFRPSQGNTCAGKYTKVQVERKRQQVLFELHMIIHKGKYFGVKGSGFKKNKTIVLGTSVVLFTIICCSMFWKKEERHYRLAVRQRTKLYTEMNYFVGMKKA